MIRFLVGILSILLLVPHSSATSEQARLYGSVVKIETATQSYDYRTPWNTGLFGGGTGTGFLIGPNRILTNAHVTSDARRVLVTRRGSSRKHPARVLHIAHDCDLALLELLDPAPFSGLQELEFGAVPALESEVSAVGYPTGGERLSVTRGVVSRIDFSQYSHSRADSHLVIQTDAAINPGNSGGPVFQNGKVIGVAFQGRTDADNVGYVIPTPVIHRFLTDIEDGRYDSYVDLGITTFPLFNPAMRQAYKLPANGQGILVSSVMPDGPSEGVLQQHDVLLKIDGQPIDSAGNIIIDGESLNMLEIVERKFSGDTVSFELIRGGKPVSATATLKPTPAARIYAVKYEQKPRYVFYGGLVFQPLSYNLYAQHQFSNGRLRQLYNDYVEKGISVDRKDLVVLTRVESDQLTTHMGSFTGQVVSSINGERVRDLRQVHEILNQEAPPEFHVIRFDGNTLPLIIPSAEALAAGDRIRRQVGITRSHRLGPAANKTLKPTPSPVRSEEERNQPAG